MQVTNHTKGHDAEKDVADWLQKQGYEIVEINWRRPQCEIDIIAQKSEGRLFKTKTLYFIEVKSRSNALHGDGFDYITPRKLAQMEKAAKYWLAENSWHDQAQMAVVSVLPGQMKMIILEE